MKKIILLTIGVFFIASAVFAQAPSKPFSIYVDGGVNMVTSPQWFKDYHKLGYHFEGGLGIKALPFIQVVGRVGIHRIVKDWTFVQGLSDVLDGGNVKIMTFGLDAKATLGAPMVPIKPYGLAGIGFAKVSEDDITFTGVGSIADYYPYQIPDQTKFYYNVGAGLELGSGPFNFFFQAKYVSISLEGGSIKYIPVSFGIKF